MNECVLVAGGGLNPEDTSIFYELYKQRLDIDIERIEGEIAIETDLAKKEQMQRTKANLKTLRDNAVKDAILAKTKEQKEQEDEADFYGFNWAPAIALLHYSEPYIEDVRIESTGEGDNQVNTIFIDKEADTNLALMLETHYLVDWNTCYGRPCGYGLFAAIDLAKQEGDPLTTFALGVMFSVKNKNDQSGLSFGLGVFIDTEFETLRDGLKDGDTTIYTDSQKATRKTDEYGPMLMISGKF